MSSHRSLWAAFVSALVGANLLAQLPPGPAPSGASDSSDAVPAAGSPAEARWKLGRETLQKGDREGAIVHLLAALEFQPSSPPILLDLARAADGADARAYWLLRWAQAATDSKGKCELDAADKKAISAAELSSMQKLAASRAQAAAELGKALDRYKGGKGAAALGNGAAARWIAAMFCEMCASSPQLTRAHGAAMQSQLSTHASDVDAVCKALVQVAEGRMGSASAAPTGADPAAAALHKAEMQLRAARILAGLARQAGYGKDLLGEAPPDLAAYAQAANAAQQAVKAQLPAPRVWTIEELQQLDQKGRDEFTLAHRSWANPGVAMSATGKYRVETTCGAETLLGTALQVEQHHARLVSHYEKDPFEGRMGTVLIVPEVSDMETEGMPFWWAGGFQGGDRTVIRFAWGNMPSLGRTLTHELAHRFDGVLRPFLRPWYGEGHASWAGGHYGKMAETQFHDDHLDLGACISTRNAGYGGDEKLKQLLSGEIDEYRDNYFAGYALYAFLRGYPPDQPPKYRAALDALEKTARAGQKDPVGHFTKTVCDGKDGRAVDFAAFCVEWREFLDGIAKHLDPENRTGEPQWVARYGPLPPGESGPLVLDENTWSWARARAEPYFGQGHAGAAGDLLAEAGYAQAAVAAWSWSFACEGWHAARANAAADALQSMSRSEQSFAMRQLGHARFPARVAAWPSGPSIAMVQKLPKTKAHLDTLLAAATQCGDAQPIARALLLAEHERLAALCALPPDAKATAALPPPPPPRSLLGAGFVDDRHVDYDKNRHVGLWYATQDGDLHVGREKPAQATGGPERDSPSRNVFVRSAEWIAPGEHVVRMKVHLTTAYVDGAIVVGHWRRDRGIRIGFSAGDPEFASGRKQTRAEADRVHVHLDGKWERDGQLPRTGAATTVEFGGPRPSFEIVLRVRGPSLSVAIEGQDQFRYTTHDGAPIEGYLGFAASRGAYRVQLPTVQRMDVALPGQAIAAAAATGLDIGSQPTASVEDLVGLPVRGIPLSPVGTLVLWLPHAEEGDTIDRRLPRALVVLSKLLQEQNEFPQLWALAVPKGSKPEEVAAAEKAIAEFRKEPIARIEHSVRAPLTGSPWLLFVDAAGILRGCNQVGDAELFSVVQRWARMFRAR